jgi:hypothetical protein
VQELQSLQFCDKRFKVLASHCLPLPVCCTVNSARVCLSLSLRVMCKMQSTLELCSPQV